MSHFTPARLARGVGYNLGGVAVPAVLGLATLPAIAAGLGPSRLGVLTLAWAALGYLGVLNLGVGRALAREASRSEGAPGLGRAAWTGVLLTLALGTVAGGAVALAAPWLAGAFGVAGELRSDTVAAFRLLGAAVPWTVGAPSLIGLLEARGRFGVVNLVGSVVSAASYLGPVLVLGAGGGLPQVVALLAAARAAGWLLYLALTLEALPAMRAERGISMEAGAAILRFGGWTSVSAAIAPVMTYMDRYLLATLVTPAAVAMYAAPQEVVVRMGALSGAVVSVLFPALASREAATERQELLVRGVAAMSLLVFPLALVLAAFARPGLELWLGAEYAAGGSVALTWLALGLMWNALAKVPAALIHASGRPEVTTFIHLGELPLYLALLWAMVAWRGVEGAAITWALRAGADAVVHYALVPRWNAEAARAARMAAAAGAAATVLIAGACALPEGVYRALWCGGALLAMCGWAAATAGRPAAALR